MQTLGSYRSCGLRKKKKKSQRTSKKCGRTSETSLYNHVCCPRWLPKMHFRSGKRWKSFPSVCNAWKWGSHHTVLIRTELYTPDTELPHMELCLNITWSICSKTSQQTPNNLLMRGSYGVSFVEFKQWLTFCLSHCSAELQYTAECYYSAIQYSMIFYLSTGHFYLTHWPLGDFNLILGR